MLALLLFLVCALAGAAAITAAGSNVGRYSYLEGDAQQYLAAASAAQLIRSELDGIEVTGTYKFTLNTDTDFKLTPDPTVEHTFTTPHKIEVDVDAADMPDPTYEFKRGDVDVKEKIAHFIMDDLITINKKAFLNDNNQGSEEYLWTGKKYEEFKKDIGEISEGQRLAIKCNEIDEEKVAYVDIVFDNDTKDYSSEPSYVRVTVTYDNIVFEMSGRIVFPTYTHDNQYKQITLSCVDGCLDFDGEPFSIEEKVAYMSTQTTTVKLDFSEAVIKRKTDSKEEAS